MIQIKICGITNKQEIEYLNTLKPEYVGFVFTKSKRQVTGEIANELCLNLDKDLKIEEPDTIYAVISELRIQYVEEPETAEAAEGAEATDATATDAE